MKKLTTTLFAFSMLIAVSSFTPPKDDIASAKVVSAFQKMFSSASDIYWKKWSEYYIANFKVNDQNFSATFNEEGELVSASRNIALSELPLSVSLALQNKYPGYTIDKYVVELTVEGQSFYYIKAENEKRFITIKANGFGDLRIENKQKK